MNPQQPIQDTIQTPTPTPQQPNPQQPSPGKKPSKISEFFSKHKKIVVIVLVALVGTIATIASFAATPSNHSGYGYTYWWSERFQETFWDGKVHTNRVECINKSYMCHDNGKLIFLTGEQRVWESDPAKNNTSGSLTSAAIAGPFIYSPGPSWVNYGTSITGNQQACFRLRDVSPSGSATIALMVRNAPSSNPYQPGKTLLTIQGQLASTFKSGYKPLCLSYYNSYSAYKQQYSLFVKSGKVRVDYVDHLTEAYYYNPYIYSYGATYSGMTSTLSQNRTTCSGSLAKTTSKCLSKSDLEAASVNKNLTNLQSNVSVTTE